MPKCYNAGNRPGNRSVFVFALAVLLGLGALNPARAALITLGAAQNITTNDTDVATNGTFVYAYAGTNNVTVNSVTFTTSATGLTFTNIGNVLAAFGNTAGPITNCSANYRKVLSCGRYSNSGASPGSITLGSLVAGNTYQIQVWCNDSRSGLEQWRSNTLVSANAVATNSVGLAFNASDAPGGMGQYAIGTFTADASTQTFLVTTNGIVATNAGVYQICALSVRNITWAGTGTGTYGLPNYYLSPTGSDTTGDGSPAHPWQTVAMARDYIATNVFQTNNITVNLRGGRYFITNTLAFTFTDSGMYGFYITYQSYPGETAIIDGGKQVTGWTQVPGKPYWVASVPTNAGFADYFRQLYVNGVRAERAHSDFIQGTDYFNDPSTGEACDGIAFATNSGLKSYSNIADLRLKQIKYYISDEMVVTGITTNSTNGLIQVRLQQPYCIARYGHGYFDATNQWMVINAFEELDEPGEWYHDRTAQKVYYYPNSFEDMNSAVVYAPVVENLVELSGDSATNTLQNLRFQGITFEHGNWFFPRDYSISDLESDTMYPAAQPGINTSLAYFHPDYEEPGSIQLTNTVGIQFIGNTLQHLAGCGIQMHPGTRNTLIQGNIFYDLTGTAVLNGHYNYTLPATDQACSNTVVADNVIRNIGSDFAGGALVENFWGNGFQLLRNDIADGEYMGFHQNNHFYSLADNLYGLGNTTVASNRMALCLTGARYGKSDGGSLYSYGVWPNSTFFANDVYDLNQPVGGEDAYNHTRGLYQDGNSYGWTWRSNVVRNVKAGIPGCWWVRYDTIDPINNVALYNFTDATADSFAGLKSNIGYTTFPLGSPPASAQAIINAAGVGPDYTCLLAHIYSGTNLALGKYAWASSEWAAGYEAANAVDWNYGTIWHSALNDTNSWWAVDLGGPYVIQRLELVPRTDLDDPTARQDFQVQAANNTNFTGYVVLGEQNSVPFAYKEPNIRNSWIRYLNNPAGYRYLRVKKTSGSNLSFSEIQVYGYLSTVPTTPTHLSSGISNNSLTLSWPSNYAGWVLLVSTNLLTTNWVVVPGSSAVTMTNVPLGGTNAALFYRLMYQP